MQEALLHYIWKNTLFERKEYLSDSAEKIVIVDPGVHNQNSGPDFTNAKIRINGTTWAGNVEIHLKSSDWNSHKHHTNPAYDNVILHVAQNIDSDCYNSSKRKIPCISLIPDQRIINRYSQLVDSEELISCHTSLIKLNRSIISFWLSALAIERLQMKTDTIKDLLKLTRNSWEEAFYVIIFKSFGFNVNSLPFEMLAKCTQQSVLAKICDNLLQIEALLFGQAGFLNDNSPDDYHQMLKNEYAFLKRKFQLKPIDKHLWKFLRLRPSNFPTIRMAQLCSLIHNSRSLFSNTLNCINPKQIYSLYSCKVSNYWKKHYTFGKESPYRSKCLGENSIDSLIINTIVPFMFVYGEQKNNEELKTSAVNLLEQVHSENNKITRMWDRLNIKCRHAADSQALLQLTNFYCEQKHCLECQIGNLILR